MGVLIEFAKQFPGLGSLQPMLITKRPYLKTTLILMLVSALSACVAPNTNNAAENRKNQSIQEAKALLSEPGDINRTSPSGMTPLGAAILLAPERVPELIQQGADVNAPIQWMTEKGSWYANYPLNLAVGRPKFLGYTSINAFDFSQDLPMIKALLAAGADPNQAAQGQYTPLITITFNQYTDFFFQDTKHANEHYIEVATLLLSYGADINWAPDGPALTALVWTQGHSRLELLRHFYMEVASRESVNTAFFTGSPEDRVAAWKSKQAELAEIKATEEKAAVEAEALRQQQYQQKRQVIAQLIDEDPNLLDAIDLMRESYSPYLAFRSGMGKVNNTPCGSKDGWSKSCDSLGKELRDELITKSNQASKIYLAQRKRIANLFGQQYDIAYDVLGDHLKGVQADPDITAYYDAQTRRMESLRRSDRRQSQAEEQRQMYDLMKYAEKSFNDKAVMIERSWEKTAQVITNAENSRKMAQMQAKLDSIDKRLAQQQAQAQQQQKALTQRTQVKTVPTQGAATTGQELRTSKDPEICSGPHTLTAQEGVYSFAEVNSGRPSDELQSLKCPKDRVVRVVNGRPDFLTGGYVAPVKKTKLDDGNFKLSTEAMTYMCLCAKAPSGTSAVSQ
ncbi:ankyrin repeat domain-containing protein [Thalassolituus hydrocarboniclasticus]|uniref:Ankyrin repeat protein n=1 Tax=Thalassolituus hydrocarboniclasticus TaxID=2742796 RepID=A0ABY6ACL4_9GAMM|nr:hypothetical protein [Thalassolituus hydrocarboniclasticus]UXD87655.1 hypothetical protein HUF19_09535 [Thalassolituus hydrocarboniclasticus]